MALILSVSTTTASASKYASIAYDANTGKVLFGTNENAPRYPASLTKIMTLYVVFDLIEQGRLSHETKIRFSAQAAAQPPSKIGLDVGQSIRLIDAIKALVTKSANDVAVAVAEHIAGSEAAFARVMTSRARKMGMKDTTFFNASGLPDSRQQTTARDMIRLGLRIQEDFPEHYKLFRTKYFRYRGKTYKNHNALLGSFPGVDGIKTGYIRASGFNLVTSVKQNGKHVVAAVFGGKTGRKRNAIMRSVLRRALKKASPVRTRKRKRKPMLVAKPKPVMRPRLPAQKPSRLPVLDQRIAVGRAPKPKPMARRRPALKPSIAVAKVRSHRIAEPELRPKPLASKSPQPAAKPPADGAIATLARRGLWDDAPAFPPQTERDPSAGQTATARAESGEIGDSGGRQPGTLQGQLAALLARSSLAQAAMRAAALDIDSPVAGASLPEEQGSSANEDDDESGEGDLASQAVPAGHGGSSDADAAGVHIQVGAYTSRGEAEARLSDVAQRAERLLDGFARVTPAFDRGATRFYRARFAGFDATSAKAACGELKRRGVDCFVVSR